MRRIVRSFLLASALSGGALLLQVEPRIAGDLVLESSDGKTTIGSVQVSLWSAAFAQGLENLTLDNVTFTSGDATFQANRIILSGLTSTRAEVEAVLKMSAEPFAPRLARLNVREVHVPEIKVLQKIGSATQTVTYKNVRLKEIVEGRIAEALVDTAGGELTDGTKRTTFSYGQTRIAALDLPALARLYEVSAAPGPNPPARIYGEFAIADFNLLDEKDGAQLSIARIDGRDFFARTVAQSWAGISKLFADYAGKDDLSDEEQNRLIATMADFLGAFDFGTLEATQLNMKSTATGQASTSSIARVAYTGATGAAQSAAIELVDLKVQDPNANVAIARISLAGFSLRPTLEGLKNLQGKSLDALDAQAARRLVPTLGTFKVTGVEIDSALQGGASKAGRVSSRIRELEFGTAKPLNGIPTEIRLSLQNFSSALPETSTDDGIKDLLALGYRNVDLSFLLSARWDEATNELVVGDLALRGADMAEVSLTGILGNVSKDVFDADQAIASVALMNTRIKSMALLLEDKGLSERLLVKTAREEKTTPDALRRTYGVGASVLVPSMLGQSPQARAVSQAVARFIAKPGRLSITAKSKDPSGAGLVEMFMLADPKASVENFEISASAE